MDTAIVSQTPSMSHANGGSNTAELIYLVALFYSKGDVTTANALLNSLNA